MGLGSGSLRGQAEQGAGGSTEADLSAPDGRWPSIPSGQERVSCLSRCWSLPSMRPTHQGCPGRGVRAGRVRVRAGRAMSAEPPEPCRRQGLGSCLQCLEGSRGPRASRLTVTGGLLADRLAPFPGLVLVGEKPSHSNTVRCPGLQVSQDLKVTLTSDCVLLKKTKISTWLSSEGTSSSPHFPITCTLGFRL